MLHDQLKALDVDYNDLDEMLNVQPLRVTPLPNGSIRKFTVKRQKAGVDITRLRPPQINASDDDIEQLLHPDQNS